MKISRILMLLVLVSSLGILAGCNNDDSHHGNGSMPKAGNFPGISFFKQGISDMAQFDSGFMPTGSQAHRSYINLLAGKLRNSCATRIERIPMGGNNGWYPQGTASITISSGNQDKSIPVRNSIPYSGLTPSGGLSAPVVVLPPLPKTELLPNPGIKEMLEPILTHDVAGKIVVVQLPVGYVGLDALLSQAFYVSGKDLAPHQFSPTFISTDLLMVLIEKALKSAGAKGFIAVLPKPIPGKQYSPYPSTSGLKDILHIPGVLVSRKAGKNLIQFLSANPGNPGSATLTVNATYAPDRTVDILTAVIPGKSDREIILGSHTDSVNVVEENGPVALMAITKYYCSLDRAQRPVSLRIVMTPAHFTGNSGTLAAEDALKNEIENKVFAAIEVEHLGAKDVTPDANGYYTRTGTNSMYAIQLSSNNDVMIKAAKEFATRIKPTLVISMKYLTFGAGIDWKNVTNTIAYFGIPKYLLSYHVPDNAVANRFLSYSLLRKQTQAVTRGIFVLANAPKDAF